MLRYLNHRFHFDGISFQIPDGCLFHAGAAMEEEHCLVLFDADETFTLELRIEEDCDSSDKELRTILHDLSPIVLQPVTPMVINGLFGHYTIYRSRRTQHYMVWLNINRETAFTIDISTTGDISAIDTAALVTAVDPILE